MYCIRMHFCQKYYGENDYAKVTPEMINLKFISTRFQTYQELESNEKELNYYNTVYHNEIIWVDGLVLNNASIDPSNRHLIFSNLQSNLKQKLNIVGIVYNVQLLKYAGEDGVVIYGLLMYVSLMFIAVFVGYSNGIGSAFSYQYGAQNHGELRNLLKKSLVIIGITSVLMFALSEAIACPFSALFLRDAEKLLPDTVRAFRIFSLTYLFAGIAVFGSAFFTALNNGLISALISFLRTFVFELGAVLLLPVLFGVDGIWYSGVFAELMAAVVGIIFMVALRKKYHY